LPECPPELSPAAQREWARLAGELSKLNLITNLDRGALATYCGAYGMWAEAMEQIQKYGTMVKSPTGFPIQSPYLSIANRQAEIMMRIASEFGFTPASRSRISAPPQDQLPFLVKLDRKTDCFTWRFETYCKSRVADCHYSGASISPSPMSGRDVRFR
jgi:P27 family predicted phage terminase small subunit